MSANYSLAVVNPNVKGSVTNVVYTGVSGGNELNLIIGNNFGFDMTIGGGSYGKYLQISISSNIIDASGASKLRVASPWTVASYQPPPNNKEPYYIFNLLPPSGGVTIPNGNTITVQVKDVEPSAVGTAQVLAYYQFDTTPSDDLSASASLSSLAPPNPNLPLLVGDNDALRLTNYVNNGASSNPIMVSASAANAVDNSIHLNLLFQTAPSILEAGSTGSGNLVPNWNPAHPPTFRIFFPYFNLTDTAPAALDLTDSFSPGDPQYNAITSARNIPCTLDPNNSKITQNTYWQIALDSGAPVPVWTVTPTAANTHLFTSVESSQSEPGPFLDLYLLDIVSVLPIDPRRPETILYFQWNNFPGFNDGIVVYPLQKTELAITSFSAALKRTNQAISLIVQWTTTGAYCFISGNTNQQRANAQGSNAYVQQVTPAQPLESSYTLTAVGQDGVTQVSRTVSVQWRVNNTLTPTSVGAGASVQITSDGKTILVLSNSTADVRYYDPLTLQPLPDQPLVPSDGYGASVFTIAPNNSAVYVISGAGTVYGYNLQTQQPTPGSGAVQVPAGSPPIFLVGVSIDSSKINVVTQAGGGSGANQMNLYYSYNLQQVASPVSLKDVPGSLAVGPQTGRYYLGLPNEFDVFDPSSLNQVSGSPVSIGSAYVLAISSDETLVYALNLNVQAQSFALSLINPITLRVTKQLAVGVGYNPVAQHYQGEPYAALGVSLDNALLFFIGQVVNVGNQKTSSQFSVFNAQTLEELSWSPIQFGDFLPVDFTMAPDGSRLYVLAGLNISSENPTISLYAVDPVFI